MKVVISGYVGKKITGIARNLIEHMNHVDDDNNQYVIYTNYDIKDEFVIKNKNVQIKTYRVSKNSSLGNLLWTTFIYPFIVIKENANVSIIPNFTLLLIKFKPTIIIMHDLIEFNVPDKFSKLKMFYRKKLANPISANIANHIVTVSENSKNDIIKFLHINEDKITVIYNGIDRKIFKPIDKNTAKDIIDIDNFILYVGTVDYPGKNVHNLIKAFELMKLNGKYNGKLVIAGMDGKGYEHINTLIDKSKCKNDIVRLGYVSNNEVVAIYNLCDIFCFISYYEGFGFPPLEALACGAKVLVSDRSSLPEIIRDERYIVNPDDVEMIGKKIIEIIINDNVKINIDRFNWDEYAKKFGELIEKYGKKM